MHHVYCAQWLSQWWIRAVLWSNKLYIYGGDVQVDRWGIKEGEMLNGLLNTCQVCGMTPADAVEEWGLFWARSLGRRGGGTTLHMDSQSEYTEEANSTCVCVCVCAHVQKWVWERDPEVGREGEREREREGGREGESECMCVCVLVSELHSNYGTVVCVWIVHTTWWMLLLCIVPYSSHII